MSELKERYQAVLENMAASAKRAGRRPEDVTLVAVTKTWPVEVLLAAYEAGMRQFGENRPDELAAKRPLVEAELGADGGIVWHFIGTVQSRKSGIIADFADTFHALDRMKIANRLSRQLVANGRSLPVLLEVNVSGEGSKSGFLAVRWETDATQQAKLRTVAQTVNNLAGFQLCGLMTMAPWHAPENEIRQLFRRTRALAAWLETAVPDLNLSQLSMGMTDDYHIAIEEGATQVRVGRALFGSRQV
ncbi:MAG: YggS family pyridoxal phosphate-dependent enzyme [Chloroflexi bacterium]|nr:MAG: YggS family pyridoxal phosphate-dependent enzyme [Chloroflexota bacterium]